MKRYKIMAAATFALLVLAACGTSGNSSIGDIFGNGSRSGNAYEIRGTVDSVNQPNHYITLTNVNTSSSLNTGGGQTVRVYYDDRTSISYQGRTYQPSDLERGDEVAIRVDDNDGQLIAQTMDVTYNSRGGMASSSGGTYGNSSVIHGTVRSVDTYRHTITINRGYGSDVIVDYSNSTPVSFNGRTYAAADLEPGDEIDIRTVNSGGRINADDITVTRTGNGMGTYGSSSSSSYATVRGTVRSVDRSARTIELDSTTWSAGFQTNTSTNRITVHYDSNSGVDYNGQIYPVTNLERGDVVDVQVQRSGTSSYVAQNIVLVRNVNGR